jgi:hypothetical protein
MSQLPTLHDATIKGIRLEWATGRFEVDLQTSERLMRLVFGGVRSVVAPREQPWGPSASVNALRRVGEGRFELEIQSGDVIQIEATDIHIE